MGRRAPILPALPAPSPLLSAPSGIGLGAGWVGLNLPPILVSSRESLDPLHIETDPAAHGLQLPHRTFPVFGQAIDGQSSQS